MYWRKQYSNGTGSAVSVFVQVIISLCSVVFIVRLPPSLIVLSLTLWLLRCAYLLTVFKFAMSGACVACSTKMLLCTPCSLITKECELTTLMVNKSRLCGVNFSYAAAAMFLAVLELVPNKQGPPKKTKLPEWKVGDFQTRQS